MVPTSKALPLLLLLLLPAAAFLAVTRVLPFAASALPYLRAYLAPPYLFLTINFIILTIWKLSEKPDRQQPNSPPPTPKPKPATYLPKRDPPPAFPAEKDPPRWAEPAAPVASATPPKQKLSVPPAPVVLVEEPKEEEEEEALSMDATWRKITSPAAHMRRSETFREDWRKPEKAAAAEMRKSETFRERRPVAASRTELLLMGQDELNRQFEAFIKKVNDQMRQTAPPLADRKSRYY